MTKPGEPWGKKRLFDLSNDVGETRDRSAEKPDVVERLHRSWLEWAEPFPPAASKSVKPKAK